MVVFFRQIIDDCLHQFIAKFAFFDFFNFCQKHCLHFFEFAARHWFCSKNKHSVICILVNVRKTFTYFLFLYQIQINQTCRTIIQHFVYQIQDGNFFFRHRTRRAIRQHYALLFGAGNGFYDRRFDVVLCWKGHLIRFSRCPTREICSNCSDCFFVIQIARNTNRNVVWYVIFTEIF